MAWTGKTFSVGAILTAADMNNLQADVSAVPNGDAGAPDVVEAALPTIAAGSSYRYHYDPTEDIHTTTTYTRKTAYFIVPRSGTYQISYEIKNFGAGAAGSARVYKNAPTVYSGDTAVGTVQLASTQSFVEKTESLALNAGDIISVYIKTGGATDIHIQNFTLEATVKQHG